MNSHVTTRLDARHDALSWSITSLPAHVDSAVVLLICVTLAVGAYLSFPLYDDAWMALMLRESGRHSLAQFMGDRPLFGYLLTLTASFGALNKIVFVVLNSISWLVIAVQSRMLFRRLFPEFAGYSVLAACLALAPIVVQTQLSTALVTIPANLATILSYAAILILLRDNSAAKPNSTASVLFAAGLAAAAVALSEYGVASNLVGCAILVGVGLTSSMSSIRRRMTVRCAWLFALTGISYLLFAKMADFSVRPDVAPAHMLHRSASKWMEVPFDVIAGVWYSLFGSFASAFGKVIIAWDSKSTLIALAFGIIAAALLCVGIQSRWAAQLTEDRLTGFPLRIATLIAAIVVGLLPFSAMSRPTTLLEYGSRFRIPILPVATAATLALVLYVVRPAFRWIAVLAFGFIVGYVSLTSAYNAVQQARAIAAIQGSLRPYIQQSDGFTVAIVPFRRFETELTATISATWPEDLEKKLWAVPEDSAASFGDRRTCHAADALNVHVRGLSRSGKLSQVLWVEAPAGKPVLIEPYCRSVQQ